MIKQITFLLFSMLLVACAPNRALKHFEKEEIYAKAIQYTNKCDILDENQVKVMFTASYLNSIDAKWNNDKENFILSVYIVETKENNEPFYHNEDYEILLDGKKYSFLEPLTSEHILFENTPLYNAWASYFMVTFNNFDEEKRDVKITSVNNSDITEKIKEEIIDPYTLNLTLNHTTFGSCTISFSKE